MKVIHSKLRAAIFIQVIVIGAILILPILGILKDDGTGSWLNHYRYPAAIIAFIWLFGGAFIFTSKSIFFIVLSGDQVTFKNIFGQAFCYRYADIVRISSKSTTLKRRFYPSPGYQIIHVEFKDGRTFPISAHVYANFAAIRNFIYKMRKGTN